MKNSQISFIFILFLSATFFACQKEAALPGDVLVNPQVNNVRTEIKFSIGEKSYALSAVRQELESSSNGAACGGDCGSAFGKDFSSDWTTYSAANNLLSVTRQDDAVAPAFRLSIVGAINLNASSLPAKVANARITLNDFAGTLIQPNDDPAYSTGTLSFEGTQDAVELTVTSRNGNVVEGTFSGTLKMPNGSAVEVRDGSFIAQVAGL